MANIQRANDLIMQMYTEMLDRSKYALNILASDLEPINVGDEAKLAENQADLTNLIENFKVEKNENNVSQSRLIKNLFQAHVLKCESSSTSSLKIKYF